MNHYVKGQVIRIYTDPPFRDILGALVDPTTVTLKITDPLAATVSKTLAAGEVIKDTSRGYANGDFYFDYATSGLTAFGRYIYTWIGTGTSSAPADKNVFWLESDVTADP